MSSGLTRKITIGDLRAVRGGGPKLPMLTCYDATMARQMQEAGVPALLVGDSAANVVLGHSTTHPVSLSFMIELTAAVRRGAPLALIMADMPFGSYHGSLDRGVRNVCRMVQKSGCDCVKLEVAASHLPLVQALADAGVAIVAHLGLRPQSVSLVGGYRVQGRTADEASKIVELAGQMETGGAAAILLEAVPPEVAQVVVASTGLPIIGCGAGPDCHATVFVTHDALGFTANPPRFVPRLVDLASEATAAFSQYVSRVRDGRYPAPEHNYEMPPDEKAKFLRALPTTSASRS